MSLVIGLAHPIITVNGPFSIIDKKITVCLHHHITQLQYLITSFVLAGVPGVGHYDDNMKKCSFFVLVSCSRMLDCIHEFYCTLATQHLQH